MYQTWTGKEPVMEPEKLHLILCGLGVTKLEAEYSGSGDSADDFEIRLWFCRDTAPADVVASIDKKVRKIHEERAEINAYWAKQPVETDRAYCDPEDFGLCSDEIRDILTERITTAGGAFCFNDEGSAGELHWDMKTNECSLTSWRYETVRVGETDIDDLFSFER